MDDGLIESRREGISLPIINVGVDFTAGAKTLGELRVFRWLNTTEKR